MPGQRSPGAPGRLVEGDRVRPAASRSGEGERADGVENRRPFYCVESASLDWIMHLSNVDMNKQIYELPTDTVKSQEKADEV